MAVVSVRGLRKTFGRGELAVVAVDDVGFEVEAGQLVALLGPSGSGKTTLLLAISLILEPTSGVISIDGTEIYRDGWTGVDARRLRREKLGFVFQSHNLIPFLSALENVALPMHLNGVDRRTARDRAYALLEYLEISHRAASVPANLSGGEQQRVAIGRALANEPRLILADEPTASLDTERGMKVMALLGRVARERSSAVIVVTHDVRMIAGFDAVYRMSDGRLSPSGRVDERPDEMGTERKADARETGR
jgi:putative ABC transport system ATP-binding protein